MKFSPLILVIGFCLLLESQAAMPMRVSVDVGGVQRNAIVFAPSSASGGKFQ
jgi:hypothetical protein